MAATTNSTTMYPAPTPARIPSTCHPSEPAWPYSPDALCHACASLETRVAAFMASARRAGFPVTETAVRHMMTSLSTLARSVPASADRRAA